MERDLLQRIYNFMMNSKMVVLTAYGYKSKAEVLEKHTQLMEEMEQVLKTKGEER